MPLSDLSTTVSLLVPADWDDMQGKSQYSIKFISAIEEALGRQGYSLKLVRLRDNETDTDLEAFDAHISTNAPAGIIVSRVLQNEPVIDLLRGKAIPFVIFGHNPGSARDAWVDIDNVAAIWLTTRKCIDLGHKRIALLNGPADYSYAVQRATGFRRAIEQAGLNQDVDLLLNGQPTFAMGSVMASYLMRQEQPPTAMVCVTDELAMGAMYACLDLGLKPGVDVSIVGYGASQVGASSTPRLASVRFDLHRAGSLLAEKLLRQFNRRAEPSGPLHELLPVEWVEGGSLDRPPAKLDAVGGAGSKFNVGKLAQATAALHRTQQVVHAGSWRFNPLEHSLEGSPEFCSVLGVARDVSIPLQAVLDLVVPADAQNFEHAWKRALCGRPFDIEARFRVEGLERALQWRGEFITNCGGLAYAEGAVQDVSDAAAIRAELEQARNDALEANRAKDLFLANMSHEIRTPIHAILGLTDLLKRQETNANASKTIDKIAKSGAGLLNIINDILLISKVESNALEVDDYSFDLQALIDELAATVEGLLSKKREVNLILPQIDTHWRYLRGDPARLSQVLLNLLGNSAKFTAVGEIELLIEALPAQKIANEVTLAFCVRDTGIGIAAERTEQLFDPFVQADNSISRTYGGTGLGLAIVDSLVRLMGGQVRVESEPGVGSTFSFELSFETSRSQEPHQRQQDRLRVLIVDDSPTARLYAAQVVLELGWSATAVESGAQALIELLRSPDAYDLLLLDYAMPGMNGLEVARQIRSSNAHSDIKIVLLTSMVAEEFDTALSLFIDGFMHKPLTADALLDVMAGEDEVALDSIEDESSETQPLAGVRLFCVDDSDINLELLVDMLEHQGAIVTTALNGAEALAQLDGTLSYDLMLCDVQMPNIDGFELTRRVHQIGAYVDLPIIGVSAGVAASRMPEALAAGMVGYIEKPFNQNQLLAAIQPVLKGRRETPTRGPQASNNVLVFDPNAALKNWTRLESFKKQLNLFAQRHTNDNEITEMVECLRFEEALQLSHKLKGVAGVLGLEQLAKIAKQLEFQLRRRGEAPDMVVLRALAAQLSKSQMQAREATINWLQTHAQIETPKTINKPIISVTLLLEALNAHDPVAAERCLDSQVDGVSTELMSQMREAVSAFDFPRAAALLQSSIAPHKEAREGS